MRNTRFAAACIGIVLIALASCKSQSVSRTYKADMDATWSAVVSVATKIAKDPPKLDREGRKITTGMVHSGVTEESDTEKGYPATIRSSEMWRGIITLSPEYGGTKVSIKVQKASSATSGDLPVTDKKEVSVGVTLGSSDTRWQDEILNAIQAELAKGK